MSSSRGVEPPKDEIDLAAELFRRQRGRRVRLTDEPPPPSDKKKEPEPSPSPKPPEKKKKPEKKESKPSPLPQAPKDRHAFLQCIKEKALKSRRISVEKLCTIYPVPPEFLDSDKNVGSFYKPKVVSIGPYHKRRKERRRLRPMEDFKRTCLYKLIYRRPSLDESHGPFMLLGTCLDKMIEQKENIQARYSKKIELDDEELARRMLLDGGFIIYLLLKKAKIIEPKLEDLQPVIGRVWIWNLVKYDLLLLENQIPFFVIKDLSDILVPDCRDFNPVDYALRYFSSLDPCRKQARSSLYIPVDDVYHLLHLVYLSVLPCSQYHKHHSLNPPSQQWIPGATKLKDFGVKFKKRKNENQCRFLSFLDIKFNDGVMEIPQLRVHDYSVSLFRNLIAFEQCHPNTQCHITAYVAFMNCLIDEEEDRRSLHLDQILVSNITKDKDGTRFFRRLCNGTHYEPKKNYLGGLINDVNKYHESTWRQWRAQLARFRGPWPIFALAVTIFALLFSITQGSISIQSYFHPRH